MAGIKAAFDKAFGKKNKTKKKVKTVRPGQGRNGNSNKANNLPKSNKTFKPAPIAEKEKKKVQEEAAKRQQAKQTTPAVKTTGGVKNINIEKEIKNKINPYKSVFTGKDAKKTIAENKAKGTVVNPTRSNYISETSKRLQKQKENATSGAMGKISQAVAKSVLDDEYNLYKKKHPTGDDEKFYAYSEQFGAENNYGDWFVKYAKQKKEEAARQKTLSEPGRNIESKGNAIGNNKMVAEKKAKEDFQQVLKASGGDLKTAIKYIDDNALGVQGSKYLDALKKEAENAYYKSQGELAKKSQDLRTVYEAQTGKEANPRSLEYQKWREKQLGAEQQKLKDTHKAMAEMTSTTATTNKALNAARTVGENIGGAYVGMVRMGDEIFGTHMADGGLDWLEEANMANKASATTKFGKTIGTDLLAQAGQLIGMAPLMQAGQLIGGAGKAAGAARTAATGLGYGFGSAGQELHNAYENGATKEEARKAAVLHGLMETAFGGISEARVFKNLGGEAAGKFIESRLRRVLREAGINAATEGGTEWLTSVSQNAASRAIYDNPDNKSLLKIIGEEITNPENLYAGALGGIMGGGMGAIGGIPNPNRNVGANNVRVEQLTRQLSDRLGISVEEVQMASQNGTLHDMAALAEKNKKVNLLTDYVATELGISAEKVRQAAYSGTLQSMAAAYERNARAKTDSTNNEFMAGVRKAMRGELASSDILKVSNETPQILQQYGAENRVMTMSQNVVRKIAYPEGYMGGKHNLGFAALEQLPQQLEDPVAILKSATQKNSIVILTELVDTEGRPVIVPVHLDKKGNLEFSNEIPSMYGRENFADFIDRQEKAGNILYTKKDRNLRDLPGNGLQLSELGNQADPIFNNSIPQNGENINGVVMEQELDERQLQVYRDMLGIAEAKGGSIVVRNDLRRGNPGFIEYDVDGTDRFRIVVADEAMVDYVVAGHEFTHSLEGTPEYGDYMTFVKDYLQEKGVDVQAVKNEIYDEYAKFGQRLVDDGEEYEMMAMFTAKHLFNDDVVIRRLKVENPNVFQRIMEWLEDVIKRLKGGEGAEFYIQARRKYLAASRAVSANQQGKGRQNALRDVRIPQTFDELIEKPDMQIVDIRQSFTEGRYADRRKQIKKNAEESGIYKSPIINKDTGESIFIVPGTYTHSFSNRGKEQLDAVENIKAIVENAVLTHAEPSYKQDNVDRVYTFFGAVRTAAGVQPVKIKVKEYNITGASIPSDINNYFDEYGREDFYSTVYDNRVLVVEGLEEIAAKKEEPHGSAASNFSEEKNYNHPQGSTISIKDLTALVNEEYQKYIPNKRRKGRQNLFVGVGEDVARRATAMETEGRTRQEIWEELGVNRTMDGKGWRGEIDDSGMEYLQGEQGSRPMKKSGVLSDFIKHDELFQKYPGIENVRVEFKDMDVRAEFNLETGTLTINEKYINAPQDLLVHEIQHAIQQKEGWSNGSNEEYFGDKIRANLTKQGREIFTGLTDEQKAQVRKYNELLSEYKETYVPGSEHSKALEKEVQQLYNKIISEEWGRKLFDIELSLRESKNTAHEMYWNTAGEIEARDAKKRRELTQEERKKNPPQAADERTVFVGKNVGVQNEIGRTVDGRKFVDIQSDVFEKLPKNADLPTINKFMRKYLKEKYPGGFTVHNQFIMNQRKGADEFSSGGDSKTLYRQSNKSVFRDKMRIADNIDELLEVSDGYVNEATKHERTDDIAGFGRGNVLLKIGEKKYTADVLVGIKKDGSAVFYDVLNMTNAKFDIKNDLPSNPALADNSQGYGDWESRPLESPSNPAPTDNSQGYGGWESNSSSNNIPQKKNVVNNSIRKNAVGDTGSFDIDDIISRNKDGEAWSDITEKWQPAKKKIKLPEATVKEKAVHTPEQLKIMQDYENSVDTDLVSFVQTAINDSHGGNRMRYLMHDVTFKESQDIKKVVGKDTSGYKHSIKGSTVVHINKRHGANGQQDQSMADINDIGRIEYVLKNYDNINLATDNKGKPKKSKWSKNKDGSYAEMVIYEKKIDGTMYVVEAVPDTKTKLLQIVSAYIKKRSNSGPEHAASSPQDTPKAPTAFAPNQSIPQKTENIKLHTLMEADTPAGEKAAKAWEEKISKKKQKIRHDDRMTLFESLINEREKAHGRLNAKERQNFLGERKTQKSRMYFKKKKHFV